MYITYIKAKLLFKCHQQEYLTFENKVVPLIKTLKIVQTYICFIHSLTKISFFLPNVYFNYTFISFAGNSKYITELCMLLLPQDIIQHNSRNSAHCSITRVFQSLKQIQLIKLCMCTEYIFKYISVISRFN